MSKSSVRLSRCHSIWRWRQRMKWWLSPVVCAPIVSLWYREKRQELTTEGGLDVVSHSQHLKEVIARLQQNGIVVSLFIDPDLKQIDQAFQVGTDTIEIHTGLYCDAPTRGAQLAELAKIEQAIHEAKHVGMGVNAGHGLNYRNIQDVVALGVIEEFNIGHSIISRAVLVGLDPAVREMKSLVAG